MFGFSDASTALGFNTLRKQLRSLHRRISDPGSAACSGCCCSLPANDQELTHCRHPACNVSCCYGVYKGVPTCSEGNSSGFLYPAKTPATSKLQTITTTRRALQYVRLKASGDYYCSQCLGQLMGPERTWAQLCQDVEV